MRGAMAEATVDNQDAELGDAGRFRVFYAIALPRVYGYFYHHCGGSVAVAEDLTQETFLAAVGELKRGKVVAAPLPWVLGIARHKLFDQLRRQRRQGWSLISWDADIADDDLVLEEEDGGNDRAAAALAAVPSPQREAIALRYIDGLSVPEVARAVDRSVPATESLLARGRASFKRHYLGTDDGE
jgi:RNA polymerase sigma-70 factor (ECF subfamily)